MLKNNQGPSGTYGDAPAPVSGMNARKKYDIVCYNCNKYGHVDYFWPLPDHHTQVINWVDSLQMGAVLIQNYNRYTITLTWILIYTCSDDSVTNNL